MSTVCQSKPSLVPLPIRLTLQMHSSQHTSRSSGAVNSAVKAFRVRQEIEWREAIISTKGMEGRGTKLKKNKDWYKKSGAEAVLFVPVTLQSQLQKRYIKNYVQEIRDRGIRIKVVVKSGTTLKQMLQRSYLFSSSRCAGVNCFVCQSDGRWHCTRVCQ